MKKYDVIVIGSGCGMNIVEEALSFGAEVALVDRGPLGGTCPNNGCIPSKMLIFAADRLMEIEEARKVGIKTRVQSIDFDFIMQRMRKMVTETREEMRHGIAHAKHLGYYEGEGHFVDAYTLEVNGETIKGGKIFVASGSRPLVPPVKGMESVDYLNNESLLDLRERPESLIIIGGGYIAVEYGHFFAAMGTRVTMLEMMDRLVLSEEPEIAEALKRELSKRMDVFTGIQVDEAKKDGADSVIIATERKTGAKKEFRAQKVLMAVGRRSNADLIKAEKAGLELDKRGYIKTNELLETNIKHIYAVGDANGTQMFTHVANRESVLAVHNAMHGSRLKMDYSATPHAIYTHPQVASVGMTEEAASKEHKVLVGRAKYSEVASGEIWMDDTGFAKVIVDAGARHRILGFHVIGPHAPVVIQEVINAMASGGNIDEIHSGMHIHPALPELIVRTLGSIG